VIHQKAAAAGRFGEVADTLAEFLERVWLPAKEGRVEVGTYEQYRWAVTRHIVPPIGAVRLGDLTPITPGLTARKGARSTAGSE
jgi:Phage integrase, N-terminal SAM-like domain